MKKFWTAGGRVIMGMGALHLGGCLDRPIPKTKFADRPKGAEVSYAPVQTPESETDGKPLIDAVLSEAFIKKERTQEEALAELLVGPDGETKTWELTLGEIRYLQDQMYSVIRGGGIDPRWLSGALNAAGGGDAEPAGDSTPAPREDFIEFDRSTCKRRENKVRVLNNGIRQVDEIYRSSDDVCFFDFSSNLVNALNRVLEGKTTTLKLNGQSSSVRTMDEFMNWSARSGFEIRAEYRTYLASFVRLHKSTGDLEDAATELPLPLWIDLETKTPGGIEAKVPAAHGEVLFRFNHANLGKLVVKIHFSASGFDFGTDEADPPHWTGRKTLITFTPDEVPQLLRNSVELRKAYDIFMKRLSPDRPVPMSGFGLVGVCTDGAAMLVKSLRPDAPVPFPTTRSDRVKMPPEFPMKAVWEAFESDASPRIVDMNAAERLRWITPRLVETYAFTLDLPSPFATYELLMRELRAGASP